MSWGNANFDRAGRSGAVLAPRPDPRPLAWRVCLPLILLGSVLCYAAGYGLLSLGLRLLEP
jgi:hypothetical protein